MNRRLTKYFWLAVCLFGLASFSAFSQATNQVMATWNWIDIIGRSNGVRQVTITPQSEQYPPPWYGLQTPIVISVATFPQLTNGSLTTNVFTGINLLMDVSDGYSDYVTNYYFPTNYGGLAVPAWPFRGQMIGNAFFFSNPYVTNIFNTITINTNGGAANTTLTSTNGSATFTTSPNNSGGTNFDVTIVNQVTGAAIAAAGGLTNANAFQATNSTLTQLAGLPNTNGIASTNWSFSIFDLIGSAVAAFQNSSNLSYSLGGKSTNYANSIGSSLSNNAAFLANAQTFTSGNIFTNNGSTVTISNGVSVSGSGVASSITTNSLTTTNATLTGGLVAGTGAFSGALNANGGGNVVTTNGPIANMFYMGLAASNNAVDYTGQPYQGKPSSSAPNAASYVMCDDWSAKGPTTWTNMTNEEVLFNLNITNLPAFTKKIYMVDDGVFQTNRDANGHMQLNTSNWPAGMTPTSLIASNRLFGFYTIFYDDTASPNSSAGFGNSGTGTNIEYDGSWFASIGASGVRFDLLGFTGLTNELYYLKRMFSAYRSYYATSTSIGNTPDNPAFFVSAASPNSQLGGFGTQIFGHALDTLSYNGSLTNSAYTNFFFVANLLMTNQWQKTVGFYNSGLPIVNNTWDAISTNYFALDAVMGVPWIYSTMIGTDSGQYNSMNDKALWDLLADPLCAPSSIVYSNAAGVQIGRPLANGGYACLLMQVPTLSNANYSQGMNFAQSGLFNGSYDVRDCLTGVDYGIWQTGYTNANIPPYSVCVLKLIPVNMATTASSITNLNTANVPFVVGSNTTTGRFVTVAPNQINIGTTNTSAGVSIFNNSGGGQYDGRIVLTSDQGPTIQLVGQTGAINTTAGTVTAASFADTYGALPASTNIAVLNSNEIFSGNNKYTGTAEFDGNPIKFQAPTLVAGQGTFSNLVGTPIYSQSAMTFLYGRITNWSQTSPVALTNVQLLDSFGDGLTLGDSPAGTTFTLFDNGGSTLGSGSSGITINTNLTVSGWDLFNGNVTNNSIVVGPSTIWALQVDGSGFMANDAFFWDNSGNVTATKYTGSGAGLYGVRSLIASNLTSGLSITNPIIKGGSVSNSLIAPNAPAAGNFLAAGDTTGTNFYWTNAPSGGGGGGSGIQTNGGTGYGNILTNLTLQGGASLVGGNLNGTTNSITNLTSILLSPYNVTNAGIAILTETGLGGTGGFDIYSGGSIYIVNSPGGAVPFRESFDTVVGGLGNDVSQYKAFDNIYGGKFNVIGDTVAQDVYQFSTIIGGASNYINSGYDFIAGGISNSLTGGSNIYAFGSFNLDTHGNTFNFNTANSFLSDVTNNSFLINAPNGVYINTTNSSSNILNVNGSSSLVGAVVISNNALNALTLVGNTNTYVQGLIENYSTGGNAETVWGLDIPGSTSDTTNYFVMYANSPAYTNTPFGTNNQVGLYNIGPGNYVDYNVGATNSYYAWVQNVASNTALQEMTLTNGNLIVVGNVNANTLTATNLISLTNNYVPQQYINPTNSSTPTFTLNPLTINVNYANLTGYNCFVTADIQTTNGASVNGSGYFTNFVNHQGIPLSSQGTGLAGFVQHIAFWLGTNQTCCVSNLGNLVLLDSSLTQIPTK